MHLFSVRRFHAETLPHPDQRLNGYEDALDDIDRALVIDAGHAKAWKGGPAIKAPGGMKKLMLLLPGVQNCWSAGMAYENGRDPLH